jgi:predicted nuclease of predicted toxin-antitoxin system
MSRPRFLADHDFDERIARGLVSKEPAIDLVRARDLGLQRAADDAVLAFAASDNRVVVSHDIHTMTAAAIARIVAGSPMAGLIIVPQRAKIGPFIDELRLIWFVLEAEELVNDTRYVSA